MYVKKYIFVKISKFWELSFFLNIRRGSEKLLSWGSISGSLATKTLFSHKIFLRVHQSALHIVKHYIKTFHLRYQPHQCNLFHVILIVILILLILIILNMGHRWFLDSPWVTPKKNLYQVTPTVCTTRRPLNWE